MVPVKLDSGAFGWVFNPETAQAFEIQETESSKKGQHFTAANGSEIQNYGKRVIKGFTGDWIPIESTVQVAEVKRNLAGAMRIMKSGNRIVLDDDGSFIEDKKTGRQINMRMENGEFEFDLWIPKPKSKMEEGVKDRKKVRFEDKNRFQALSQMDVDSDGDHMLEMVFMGQV